MTAYKVKFQGLYIDGHCYKAGQLVKPEHARSIPDYFLEQSYVEAVNDKPTDTRKAPRKR